VPFPDEPEWRHVRLKSFEGVKGRPPTPFRGSGPPRSFSVQAIDVEQKLDQLLHNTADQGNDRPSRMPKKSPRPS